TDSTPAMNAGKKVSEARMSGSRARMIPTALARRVASARALELGTHCSSSAAAKTRCLVATEMGRFPLYACETVAFVTPAAAAPSPIVGLLTTLPRDGGRNDANPV